ncbi:sensor histidine kinase [Halarcobacter ebronensis]|uniref:histidine kinase n=1 Tax=Halarcobacter ebronensis TaxID=1462615 RepID=A0A4Q1AK55_9BACT|nr:HAMP domain-containing sensor histidine kinase [Halarcobacter ebronensis]QKF82176.1 two-component system sensor histidine kinase [Halarcobacter ebronensis]RXK03446.1 histidine kinase [Halarcobacter ebronensis]
MSYNKKTNFLITNAIIVLFVLLLSLFVNYYLTSLLGFNRETYLVITLSVLIFGLILYLLLSKSIFEPIFKSDENLQKTVKETLHELNIPISTIKLNTQMLEKKISDEKALTRLNRIKLASNELLKLYEDMEYHIKKEIDRVDIINFSLKEVIEYSLDKFADLKNNIKIEVDIQDVTLNSDRNGFQKMLDNLISNALKYNLKENGLIKIVYKNKNLTIFNKGKEIDTKNLFMIFDKFFQEDKTKEGFGLGLFMVKEFCDKNKIAIKIEPTKDGNSFILSLKNIIDDK